MTATMRRKLAARKRRIALRIKNQPGVERRQPMMTASNIHYEIADRTRAIAPGGIGAIHLMAQKLGLVHDINENLHLLKRHLPYFESDHVLNIAYNLLSGGSRIEQSSRSDAMRRGLPRRPSVLNASPIPPPPETSAAASPYADVERLMDTPSTASSVAGLERAARRLLRRGLHRRRRHARPQRRGLQARRGHRP